MHSVCCSHAVRSIDATGALDDSLNGFWCVSLICIPSDLSMCSTTPNRRFMTCTVRTRRASRAGSNDVLACDFIVVGSFDWSISIVPVHRGDIDSSKSAEGQEGCVDKVFGFE